MDDTDYELAAERGAAWLDKVAPGWEQYVDLDRMQMSSPTLDVTAMVFKGTGDLPENESSDAWHWLCDRSAWGPWLRKSDCYMGGSGMVERTIFLGFSTNHDFAPLTAAWKRLIEERTGVLA